MLIRKVALVGTGTLGTQIAALTACFDYEVTAYDTNEESFHRGVQDLRAALKNARKTPIVNNEKWEEGIRKVKLTDQLDDALAEADLVIEAVPEDLAVKRATFKDLDSMTSPDAILATNSSSIPISKIESATDRPERCLNIHFYIPAMGLNMADVMGGAKTTPETIDAGKGWVRSLGCVPLTVKKETLGFCFNRIWRAVKKEALHMWAEGYVDFEDIDRGWMIFTGMPVGPFGLMDGVGLDVVHDIEMVYYDESGDPTDQPPEALKEMLDQNKLGVKTGKGFYFYPDPEYKSDAFIKA